MPLQVAPPSFPQKSPQGRRSLVHPSTGPVLSSLKPRALVCSGHIYRLQTCISTVLQSTYNQCLQSPDYSLQQTTRCGQVRDQVAASRAFQDWSSQQIGAHSKGGAEQSSSLAPCPMCHLSDDVRHFRFSLQTHWQPSHMAQKLRQAGRRSLVGNWMRNSVAECTRPIRRTFVGDACMYTQYLGYWACTYIGTAGGVGTYIP